MEPTQKTGFTPETREVARGAFVNLIGNLGKLSHFGFDIIAARMMGQQIFGYYSTTYLIMHLSFIVCYFGAHRLIIDYVVKNKNEDNDELYRGVLSYLILSFLLSGLLVMLVYLFAHDIALALNKPPLEHYLKILVWSAPFYCCTTILLSATRGLKIMKFWVLIRTGIEPLSDLIMIASLFFVFELYSAPFYAKVISFSLGAAVSFYIFQKYFSIRRIFRIRPDILTWKRISTFGFPVMTADFLSIVTLRLDIIPLSILVPSAQVAIFQVILNIGNIMRNLPQAIDPIMMPIVVEMKHRKDMRALENIYSMLIRIGLFLCFGFFVFVSVFGDLLLSLYGNDFVAGAAALIMVCLGIMIHTTFSSIEPVLVMSGFPYLNLFNNLFFVAVNLTIDFLLIPSYGIYGAAIGSLSASISTSVIQIVELYLVLKLKPLRWNLLYIFLFGLVFFVLFTGIDNFIVGTIYYLPIRIACICLYFFAYLTVGWKWYLNRDERSLFSSMLNKKI
ncbi:oligosaccharide flippase family protein [bacterium]|nr:oligosaccharide flippase family protein [bacterium]